jgi:hypothetical protein
MANRMEDDEDFIGMAEALTLGSEPPVIIASNPKAVPPAKAKKSANDGDPDMEEPGGKQEKKQLVIPNLVPDPALIPADDFTLTNFIKDGEDPKNIYDRVVLEMAEEALHMKHLRQAAQALGVPFNSYSRDRVAVLKDLSSIMATKAKELAARGGNTGGPIDFASPEFQRVMKFLFVQIMDSAKAANIPEHSIKLMASGLQQRLNGFETKAHDLYYDKTTVKGEMPSRSGDAQ